MQPLAIPTVEDILGLRQNLDRFLKQFDDCIRNKRSRRHLHTYVHGQTSKLERKSIEPIALANGVAPRTLQEFLGLHRWDEDLLRLRIQEVVMQQHPSENAIGVIDETSVPKKGDKTAGVTHQYCGATGKQDNCVVTVHLDYVTDTFATMIDGDLFLPEDTWAADRARCRAAGIPDEVQYRPKWKIALELLDRSLSNGVRLKYVTADEFYGRGREFRDGVADRGLLYVVEIPCNLQGWTKRPPLIEGRTGKLKLADGAEKARRVDHVWLRGGPSWTAYHIKDTEKGPVVWEARATRFFPRSGRMPADECGLLVARNVLTGERKYFYSNASQDVPVVELLKVAFTRSRVEESFQNAKGEIGFNHFEVRNHKSLQRHLVLSMISLLFLMENEQRLKEKKSVVECAADKADSRNAA